MTDDPVAAILSRIEGARHRYHRLILVAGAGGSGKTAALRAVAQATGAPVLNLSRRRDDRRSPAGRRRLVGD